MARKRQNSSASIPHGRKRTLSPGFFVDPALLELPPLHRLLFEGLWCFADREGRLLDKPTDLKIRILPMDACDCNSMLGDLAGAGVICRYEAGGFRCLAMKPKSWKATQRIHPDEPDSALPPPPDAFSRSGMGAEGVVSVHGNPPTDPISGPGSSGSSCLRDPRDLFPQIPSTPTPPAPPKPKPEREPNDHFELYKIFQSKRRDRLEELGEEPIDEEGVNIGRACATTAAWRKWFNEKEPGLEPDRLVDLLFGLIDAYLADPWGAGAEPAKYPFAAFSKTDYWQRLAGEVLGA